MTRLKELAHDHLETLSLKRKWAHGKWLKLNSNVHNPAIKQETGMNRGSLLKSCTLCVLAMTVCILGCAHTMSSESTRVQQVAWQADLDEYQEILLSVSLVQDSENGEVRGTHEELTLEVRPRPSLQYKSLLKSVELRPGTRAAALRYENIQVRADDSRRRVWFVDVAAQRVIATLDRDTRVATGPDGKAPPWATVDGGVLLGAGK